ncbi:MAG: UDP-N-acetylmuramate--L-alanine ligase [Planctomycetota bacterium]|nr:MAG: UDP-N-acetylmuramate--L-alanine ligase [Planctomycetota bacterium]
MPNSARTRSLTNGSMGQILHYESVAPGRVDRTSVELPTLSTGTRVHMIGIGGCGMCGAAAVLLRGGVLVSGSDMKGLGVLARLADQGAVVHEGQASENLPEHCDLVVCSSAIKESNPELAAARRRSLKVVKYSQLLGMLMAPRVGIAVAGTHGKSTTTAMIAFVLRSAGLDPSFVIGADVEQLGSGSGVGDGEHFVVEACEYDRSFLNLRPKLATILNVDEDHLDYYRNLDEIVESFRSFASLVTTDGWLVVNGEDSVSMKAVAGLPQNVEKFGLSGESEVDWEAQILDTNRGCSRFRVLHCGQPLTEVRLAIPGQHNVANALATMAICFRAGVEPETIAQALGEFRGARRRLTLHGIIDGVAVVDDYAHHPNEIKATLRAARDYYRPRKMFVVFQPHQHSRTRFLLNDFAKSFGVADEVIVPDIYFVRDSESERDLIDARDLVERIHQRGGDAQYEPHFANIVSRLCGEVQSGDLVLTMGAGDVWQVADKLLEYLSLTRDV